MNEQYFLLLEKLFNKSLIKQIIYPENENTYVFYNEYTLVKKANIVEVQRYRDEKKFNFLKVKNATAWIVLDRHNKFYEASRILELDPKLESIRIDKIIHSKNKKQDSLDAFLIKSTKLQQDHIRQRKFQEELDKYITMAKNCQIRGFENELTRNSRK